MKPSQSQRDAVATASAPSLRPWRAALACGALGVAGAGVVGVAGWAWPAGIGQAGPAGAALAGTLVALAGRAGMALAGRAGMALAGRGHGASGSAASVPVAAGPGHGRTEQLLRQVVPVWQRTAESVRQVAERDAEALTERFAKVSAHLDVALAATAGTPQMDAGAIDALMERHQPEIDRLRADARAAIDAAAAAMQAVQGVGEHVQVLGDLVKELQGIARATQMLGLNASVEATRAGVAGGGFAVVAHDIRELSTQSRQAAAQMAKEIDAAQQRLAAARRLNECTTLDDEDLALRIDIHARAALRAIVASLGDVARSSRTLLEAGRQARCDVDDILMGLQGQDRVNQMLQSVVADIERMGAWLQGRPDEAARSPADWLERLEQSYTMEDMRSSHHGTKQVQASSGVEFF